MAAARWWDGVCGRVWSGQHAGWWTGPWEEPIQRGGGAGAGGDWARPEGMGGAGGEQHGDEVGVAGTGGGCWEVGGASRAAVAEPRQWE